VEVHKVTARHLFLKIHSGAALYWEYVEMFAVLREGETAMEI
jgi:hypothetical protein